jgi:hypothetical protein
LMRASSPASTGRRARPYENMAANPHMTCV